MFSNLYPRVETIIVPDNIRREFIGRVASYLAAEFLEGISDSQYNRKATRLVSTGDPRVFNLLFEGARVILNPSQLEVMKYAEEEVPNTSIAGVSRAVPGSGLADGNQKGHGGPLQPGINRARRGRG